MGSWFRTLPVSHTACPQDRPARPAVRPTASLLPAVISRDFAYANNGPVALGSRPSHMSRSSVRNVDAHTFAEYVLNPILCRLV